jgi:polysaccharide export outer membrane protein
MKLFWCEERMKTFSLTVKASVWVILCFCLLAGKGAWAAESGGEQAISADAKEQYRQEVLGKKGKVQSDREYVIGYRDILYVEVYGEGSMAIGPGNPATEPAAADGAAPAAQDGVRNRGVSGGSEVGADGRVSLRHVGDVYVVGMTLPQVAEYLKKLYKSVYGEPNVIATLLQSNSRQYTMMGKVKNPGLFHLDYPTLLVKAVAKAGGFNEWANSKVTVIRQGNDLIVEKGQEKATKKVEKFEFDYDDYLAGKNVEKNIEVEPGDVVVVH